MQGRADRVISWVLKRRVYLAEAETFEENGRGTRNNASGRNWGEPSGVVAREVMGRKNEACGRTSALFRAGREWV